MEKSDLKMEAGAARLKFLLLSICMILFSRELHAQFLTEEEVMHIMEEPTVRSQFNECVAKGPHPESVDLFFIVDEKGNPELFKTDPPIDGKMFMCFQSATDMVVFSATGHKYELSYPMDLPPYEGEAGPGPDTPEGKPGGKPEVRSKALMISGAVTLAVGSALTVAGTFCGIRTLTAASDLESKCPGDVCPPEYRDRIDTMNSLALSSDILLGIGAASMVTGIILLSVDRVIEKRHASILRLALLPPSGLFMVWRY
jgi:hypothetical protein